MAMPDETLERVAGAITDGLPVPWESEKAARPELSGSLEVLRQLDIMAKAHGGVETGAMDETVDMRASQPGPEPPREWGRLRIVEKIGEGSFGEVYRAHDPMLQIDVALKLLRPGDRSAEREKEFLTEAQRLARIRHPHVLAVHGADRHDGRAGMWTDLLEGQTLEALLAAQGTLGPREAAGIGLDLLGALAVLHAANLVHRDVKTENVMRERGGRIVLLDLGCGVELPRGGAMHESGTVRGTPLAMAPEQLQGRTAGPATDLYGLGVLLYRLVTRHYPLEASSFWDLVQAHNAGAQVRLRDRRADLPAAFVRVVERATDPDPALRFQSAGEMERALADAFGLEVSSGEERPQTGTRARALEFLVHKPAGRLAAAAVLVAVASLAWLATRPPARVDTPASNPAANGARPNLDSAGRVDGSGAVAATFGMTADLFRETSGGAEERLNEGSQVAPGDELFLEVEGTRPLHVYVVAEDQQGKVFVLFPGPSWDQKNPLPGGAKHRLPGTMSNANMNWKVTSRGGDEALVVIGSVEPLPELERDIAAIPAAAPGAPVEYGELSDQSKAVLYRGIGGVGESRIPARSSGPRVLPGLLRSLPGGAKRADGLWVWQIQLSNP